MLCEHLLQLLRIKSNCFKRQALHKMIDLSGGKTFAPVDICQSPKIVLAGMTNISKRHEPLRPRGYYITSPAIFHDLQLIS